MPPKKGNKGGVAKGTQSNATPTSTSTRTRYVTRGQRGSVAEQIADPETILRRGRRGRRGGTQSTPTNGEPEAPPPPPPEVQTPAPEIPTPAPEIPTPVPETKAGETGTQKAAVTNTNETDGTVSGLPNQGEQTTSTSGGGKLTESSSSQNGGTVTTSAAQRTETTGTGKADSQGGKRSSSGGQGGEGSPNPKKAKLNDVGDDGSPAGQTGKAIGEGTAGPDPLANPCDYLGSRLEELEQREILEEISSPPLGTLENPPTIGSMLDDNLVWRAIASVTEAISELETGPRFSLIDTATWQSALGNEGYNVRPMARPGNEVFIPRVDHGHMSLFVLRRNSTNPDPNLLFAYHIDTARRYNFHRDSKRVYTTRLENALNACGWAPNGARLTVTATDQDHPARQGENWECGFYVILFAWAHALGLKLQRFNGVPAASYEIFSNRITRLVRLALCGQLDSETILAFLRCYGFIKCDNETSHVVPPDRAFGRTHRFVTENQLLNQVTTVRLNEELAAVATARGAPVPTVAEVLLLLDVQVRDLRERAGAELYEEYVAMLAVFTDSTQVITAQQSSSLGSSTQQTASTPSVPQSHPPSTSGTGEHGTASKSTSSKGADPKGTGLGSSGSKSTAPKGTNTLQGSGPKGTNSNATTSKASTATSTPPAPPPADPCDHWRQRLRELNDGSAGSASAPLDQRIVRGDGLEGEIVWRAIASVTEAVSRNGQGVNFSLVDGSMWETMRQNSIEVAGQLVARPGHEVFIPRVEAIGPYGHTSLYIVESNGTTFRMRRYDTANLHQHRAAPEYASSTQSALFGAGWNRNNESLRRSTEDLGQHRGRQQPGEGWLCGYYITFYAWARALGLDFSHFQRIAARDLPRFLAEIPQIVGFALRGLLSSADIESFLRCYGFVPSGAQVHASRSFDHTQRFLTSNEYTEYVTRTRVEYDLQVAADRGSLLPPLPSASDLINDGHVSGTRVGITPTDALLSAYRRRHSAGAAGTEPPEQAAMRQNLDELVEAGIMTREEADAQIALLASYSSGSDQTRSNTSEQTQKDKIKDGEKADETKTKSNDKPGTSTSYGTGQDPDPCELLSTNLRRWRDHARNSTLAPQENPILQDRTNHGEAWIRAIAAVTERLSTIDAEPRSSLMPYRNLAGRYVMMVGRPPASSTRPQMLLPIFFREHISLLVMNWRGSEEDGQFFFSHYDSAEQGHRNDRTSLAVQARDRLLEGGWEDGPRPADCRVIDSTGIRQIYNWESGLFMVLHAWAAALGLQLNGAVAPGRHSEFITTAIDVINLATQGSMDSETIEALLGCFGLLVGDQTVSPSRRFDSTFALPSQAHLDRRYLEQELNLRREGDPTVPATIDELRVGVDEVDERGTPWYRQRLEWLLQQYRAHQLMTGALSGQNTRSEINDVSQAPSVLPGLGNSSGSTGNGGDSGGLFTPGRQGHTGSDRPRAPSTSSSTSSSSNDSTPQRGQIREQLSPPTGELTSPDSIGPLLGDLLGQNGQSVATTVGQPGNVPTTMAPPPLYQAVTTQAIGLDHLPPTTPQQGTLPDGTQSGSGFVPFGTESTGGFTDPNATPINPNMFQREPVQGAGTLPQTAGSPAPYSPTLSPSELASRERERKRARMDGNGEGEGGGGIQAQGVVEPGDDQPPQDEPAEQAEPSAEERTRQAMEEWDRARDERPPYQASGTQARPDVDPGELLAQLGREARSQYAGVPGMPELDEEDRRALDGGEGAAPADMGDDDSLFGDGDI